MAFAEHTCFTLLCDSCGDGWEEGPWHFTSQEEALDCVRKCDWLLTAGKVLCPSCAETAVCEATGHQLTDWEDRVWEGAAFRRRNCGHCSLIEYDPPFEELSDLLHVARTVNGLTEEGQ